MIRIITAIICIFSLCSPSYAQTLFETLQDTYQHYDRFKALQAEKITAEERVVQAYRQRYPNIAADVSYGVGHINRYEAGDENMKRRNASVRLVQNVWTGGRFDAQLDTAQAEKIARFAQSDDDQNNVIYQAGITYLNLVKMQKLKALYTEFNGVFTDYHKKTTTEFETGSRTSAEVEIAAARLAENKAEYSNVSAELQNLQAEMFAYTGQPVENVDFPVASQFKLPADLKSSLVQLSRNNPTLQQSKADIDVAKAELDGAEAETMPNLTFEASDNYQNTDVFNTDKVHYSMLMARVNVPIFQRGVEYSLKREKTAAYHENRYKYNALQKEVMQDFTESWWRYNGANDRFSAYQKSVDASKKAVSALRKEYDFGFGSAITVLDQEKMLLTSQIALVNLQAEQSAHALKMLVLLNRTELWR